MNPEELAHQNIDEQLAAAGERAASDPASALPLMKALAACRREAKESSRCSTLWV